MFSRSQRLTRWFRKGRFVGVGSLTGNLFVITIVLSLFTSFINPSVSKINFFNEIKKELILDPSIMREFDYLLDNDPDVIYLAALIKSIRLGRYINYNSQLPISVEYYQVYIDDWCLVLAKYCIHNNLLEKVLEMFLS